MARKLTKDKLTRVDYGNGISRATPAVKGMFFFSGTGPAGSTCNWCQEATDATVRDSDGKPKGASKVRCRKAMNYTAKTTPAFSPEVAACKYFNQRDKPLLTSAFEKFKGVK